MTAAIAADARSSPRDANDFSRETLLIRYACGRVKHFAFRQVMTFGGGIVLAVMNTPLIGLMAIGIALLGEGIDCLFLRHVPKWFDAGYDFRLLSFGCTLTAALQALTISACVLLAWLGDASQISPLFVMAFLAGAAVNGGIVLPYHPASAYVRLGLYVLTAVAFFGAEAFWGETQDRDFVMDACGALILAYVVYLFLLFVDSGFKRSRQNLSALVSNGKALEAANQKLMLRQKETQRLSLVAKNANDSVLLIDSRGRIIWVNQAFSRITGFAPHEAIGRTPSDLLNSGETNPETISALKAATEMGKSFRGEIQNRTRDGRIIWIETNQVPVLDEQGRVEVVAAIERDITESKKTAAELAKAKQKAEEGARAKAEFLATMSHEIRTPMNGVIGMADLIAETELNEEQQLYADTIRSSAQALLTIINDVLDMSKLDAKKMTLNPVDFGLEACLRDAVLLLGAVANEKGLKLELILADDLPAMVHADDGRLRQVLINLIGNAIKFTEQGSVRVTARCKPLKQGVMLHIDVADTGIGIDQNKLAGVFERFSQADSATTRRFGGTGLGLTISKMLVETMGGAIGVSSQIDMGTCFSVSLPVGVCNKTGDERSIDANSLTQADGLEGIRVLVAEDNRVNRLLMEKYLKGLPIFLDFAHDGQQAVDMVLEKPPDLVFMDMSMPVMNGIEATRVIRAQSLVQPIIVALTANAFDSDRVACLDAGMNDFLSKPIRRLDLVATMVRHCSVVRVSAAQ